MTPPPNNPPSTLAGRGFLPAFLALTFVIFACAAWANLSFAVTDLNDYRFFPPFEAGVNQNKNKFQNGEYFNIGKALANGEGFAHPFSQPTGPTAWTPPALPFFLAGLFRTLDGDKDAVMAVLIFLQVFVMIGTGLLIMTLAAQTCTRVGPLIAATIFLGGLLCGFRWWFQQNFEWWLTLLAMDVLVMGFCWFEPLANWKKASSWGIWGGLCALINPIAAMIWGLLSLKIAYVNRSWLRFTLALLLASGTLVPWTVRNYQVFGRIIPVRSNLAFELYQSQCLVPTGLLGSPSGVWVQETERQQFKALGEIAFLDLKRKQFWDSVWADPVDYLDRTCHRFLVATVWYEPLFRAEAARRPWMLWTDRVIHALPFFGFLFLCFSATQTKLHQYQWIVMGAYVIYLLPYIAISYYDRYALPLLGVKVLLVIWAADRLLSPGRLKRPRAAPI